MSAFTNPLELESLTGAQGIRIDGALANDLAGYSVASAGDVNGDGVDDIVFGAGQFSVFDPNTNTTTSTTAPVYVLFGKSSGLGSIDLGNLGESGFMITGALAPDNGGVSVSSAGDFNGDGFADVLIGAPGNGASGSSYVVYGKASGFSTVNLNALGAAGFTIAGNFGNNARTGTSVSAARDIDGDGFDDLIIGSPTFRLNPGEQQGLTSVVYGRSVNPGTITLDSGADTTISTTGIGSTTRLGGAVAGAGDVNGDGFADVIMGGIGGNSGTGIAYVRYGSATGLGNLDLIVGAELNDQAGYSVAGAGDINGDGFSDLIIGAPDVGANDTGAAYVVFGKAAGFGGQLNLASLTVADGFTITGDSAGNFSGTGFAVSAAGDVNGDGYSDLMIGRDSANAAAGSRGVVHLMLGKATGFMDINLATPPAELIRIIGASNDFIGSSIGLAGDVNADGRSDLIVGASFADYNARVDSGSVYVLFSQDTGGVTYNGTSLADLYSGSSFADTINGGGRNDRLLGNGGADTIDGGVGDDFLFGGSDNDVLTGGDGNDQIHGQDGNDTMTGGLGDDTYVIDSVDDTVVENASEGDDTAFVTVDYTTASFGQNIETIRVFNTATTFIGSASDEQIVSNAGLSSNIAGGGGADVLWGSSLNNFMDGGDGDDVIRSQGGGGTFVGGDGNDQFVVANLATMLVEGTGSNSGTDTAWLTVNGYTVGANIEIVRLGGTATQVTGGDTGVQVVANPTLASSIAGGSGDDVLWGSSFADTMTGNAGNDIFRGQGGNDLMAGGQGDDQYVVFTTGCIITENPNEGADIVYVSFATAGTYVMGANVEEGRLYDGANGLVGNASNNLIVGNNAGVASTLSGRGGDDLIYGTAAADTIDGGAGADILRSEGGADLFLYGAAGWGQDQITGFVQGEAKLDFRGSGISFGQLQLVASGANTGVLFGADNILVFNAALTETDFLFG